jgi:hypothetical protein
MTVYLLAPTDNATGKGSVVARHELFKDHAAKNSSKDFTRVWGALKKRIDKGKHQAQAGLKGITSKGVEEVKTALMLSLDTMRGSGDTTTQVQKLVNDWRNDWMFPRTDPNHIFRQELSIPETLTVEDLGCEHVAVSARGVNYYDMFKTGSKKPSDDRTVPDLQTILDQLSSV